MTLIKIMEINVMEDFISSIRYLIIIMILYFLSALVSSFKIVI